MISTQERQKLSLLNWRSHVKIIFRWRAEEFYAPRAVCEIILVNPLFWQAKLQ